MPTERLDHSILEAAILGFESQRKQIDTRIAELRQMLDSGPTQGVATPQALAASATFLPPHGEGWQLHSGSNGPKVLGESELSTPATPGAAEGQTTDQ